MADFLDKNIADKDWWREAVIYQIYPRSYQDSNNDGIGDLKGITQRLPYIHELGVDAIWVSPFFTSPMKDFGYDIENYKDVDEIFGTLDDFKELLAKAHSLNLKVLIDLVVSHTADSHPWFIESKQNKSNDKSDWFVWADAKKDGTPPNNWLSVFGGSSWQWNTNRQQYYLHNFLSSQPDLNFHNQEVQNAVLDITKFWLELGIDGFRMDTINFYFHDKLLRDNPGLDEDKRRNIGSDNSNPYIYQMHLYDKNRPENLDFLKRFRGLLNQYPAVTSIGEVGDSHRSLEIMAQYSGDDDKVHMCYSFHFLNKECPTAISIKDTINNFIDISSNSWASWTFSNHDCERYASRWKKSDDKQQDWLKMLATVLLTIKGTPCLYQGEELGLEEANIEYKDLQDPYGIEFWPKIKGRDGCRTPMVWEKDSKHNGFSEADKCWLPVDVKHNEKAVNEQENDKNSLLQYYKNILAFRKKTPALKVGDIEFVTLESNEEILSFYRTTDNQKILCLFNFSENEIQIQLSKEIKLQMIEQFNFNSNLENKMVKLKPYGVFLAKILS